MMEEPNGMQIVPSELLQALAAEVPIAGTATSGNGSAQPSRNGAYMSRLLVEKWLADRGVTFRIKSKPDGKGRTVYVLAQCPFDASHGDPDSCIMQAPDGKLSAQCFHNSCRGRGWQMFKQAIGRPEKHHYDPPLSGRERTRDRKGRCRAPGSFPTTTDTNHGTTDESGGGESSAPSDGLPWIQGNKRQLRDVTDDALAALLERNNPPSVFQRGGLLTRLRIRIETGGPYLEPLTDHALRGVLSRVANWLSIRINQRDEILEDDAPPMEVVKDLAALPGWDGIPPIEAIIEAPAFQLLNIEVYLPWKLLAQLGLDHLCVRPRPSGKAFQD